MVVRPMTPQRASLFLLLLASACGGTTGLENRDVKVRTTSHPASSTRAPVVGASWFVYFADEALDGMAGTDLNGDGDRTDQVAFAVRLGSLREDSTGAAALDAAVSGSDVWLVVDEGEDGRDWNASGMADDVVLLHWEASTGALTYVDTLEGPQARVLEVDTRVYYASADPLGAGDVTNLRYLERGSPTTPVAIENEVGAGGVRARLLGEEDELIVLAQDEADAGRDLNGDGDQGDASVLALLDGERKPSRLQNIGLALADDDAPWGVRRDFDRWLLGVLVDEQGQGANLNDPLLFGFELGPDSCGADDADTDDQVLFFVRFPDYQDPDGLGNTGLAGRDRVVVVRDYVATLSDEADAGGCDLNEDGDTSDLIVRWALAEAAGGVVTVEPPRESRQLVAVDPSVPGGSFGLAALRERWIALVDEAADGRDHDGRPADSVLVAWIDPDDPDDDDWTFAHQSPSNRRSGTAIFASDGASEPYAGASWMAAEALEGRLGFAFREAVPGVNPLVSSLNNNVRCTEVVKDSDLVDSLPVWLDFASGPTLDFDGTGFATPTGEAGLVVSRAWVYFRVSELEDNRDWNEDGDLADVVLVRNPAISCDVEVIDVCTSGPGPAVLARELTAGGAAFLSTGVDFDGDGNPNELVVRHFAY